MKLSSNKNFRSKEITETENTNYYQNLIHLLNLPIAETIGLKSKSISAKIIYTGTKARKTKD